ncbi:MAG: signal peptidase I [Pseudomonadota bacterium]|nr:signal peptidase I [Pseudomonadota bacterium]
MDFSLLLVVLTGVSGFIWLAEITIRRLKSSGSDLKPSSNFLVDYSRSFFPVLLLVLIVRSFAFEPFRIPSSSMLPTLLVGDFIFVNKFTYGLRLPVIHNKVLELGQPERGDVVVFRLPTNPKINYIKRLVGLPGDTILYQNKRIYINGELVNLSGNKTYALEGKPSVLFRTEQLGDVSHGILLEAFNISREGKFDVPSGHYFMMGDNRDNSLDSRYADVGFVPEENLVGKAVLIWMNWDFPSMPKWLRIGETIE